MAEEHKQRFGEFTLPENKMTFPEAVLDILERADGREISQKQIRYIIKTHYRYRNLNNLRTDMVQRLRSVLWQLTREGYVERVYTNDGSRKGSPRYKLTRRDDNATQ